MPDIASISTAITAVKTALEISKTIGNIDHSLEKSELKLKIIELRESLVDAKNELLNVQELIQDKDKKIAGLKDLLKVKSDLEYDEGFYISKTEDNGTPYCPHCWEVNMMAIHLNLIKTIKIEDKEMDELIYTTLYTCTSCKNSFNHS